MTVIPHACNTQTPSGQQTTPGLNRDAGEWQQLYNELSTLREGILKFATQSSSSQIAPEFVDSARNLLHYLYLRRHDLRPLQTKLANLGLSSLGRCEGHVLHSIDAPLLVLNLLLGQRDKATPNAPDLLAGRMALEQHTDDLLGPAPRDRKVRIMVTMPGEADQNPEWIEQLLQQGMDCARINCAHDNPKTWLAMIGHLRQAEANTGKRCRVLMDLAGPKLRTGPIQPGPAVCKVRPQRNAMGQVMQPARIWITSMLNPLPAPQAVQASLQVEHHWMRQCRSGQSIRFKDARGAKRVLRIHQVLASGVLAELDQTAYFTNGLQLSRTSKDSTLIVGIPYREAALLLAHNDTLVLTRKAMPGKDAVRNSQGHIIEPARISCTLPEVFADLAPGQCIWFDDGKIGGIIESIDNEQAFVRIQQVRQEGATLRADKGINLPDTHLHLSALTVKDKEDLRFIVQHADMVALSFASCAGDVLALHAAMTELSSRQPGIVLKIETRRGLDNLPAMLFAAMRNACCGVMIARGDLAVECGFERLAEIQEEVLWLCEAAHVPVIWATQVLETLAKTGLPSRAEITDAAMSDRAECVMLNKGPHILRAVQVLDDILRRMQQHQSKKSAMLRALHLANGYPPAQR